MINQIHNWEIISSLLVICFHFHDFGVNNNLLKLSTLNLSLDHIAFTILLHNCNLKLISCWLHSIHRLCQHFHCKLESIIETALFVVLILQCWDGSHTVLTSGVGVPRSIVTWRVRAVKLIPSDSIVASIHQRNTVRSSWAKLSGHVLTICDIFDKLFDIDGSMHRVQVLLGDNSSFIN